MGAEPGRWFRDGPRCFFQELRGALQSALQAALELDYPGKDGTTRRGHLLQVYEATGRWSPELDKVEVPPEGEYLWSLYWELRRDSALTFQEVEAWGRIHQVSLSPWEVGTLRGMDGVLQAGINQRLRGKAEGDG